MVETSQGRLCFLSEDVARVPATGARLRLNAERFLVLCADYVMELSQGGAIQGRDKSVSIGSRKSLVAGMQKLALKGIVSVVFINEQVQEALLLILNDSDD